MDSQSLKGLSLVALLFMLSLAACTQDAPDAAPVVMQLHGQTMGTSYSVKIINPPSGLSQTQVENGLQKQLEMVNAHFSTYLSDSELSRFNANPSTDWISVSEPLLKLIQTALALSRDSDGAFDITVGPLVNLWGFGPEIRAEHIPDAAQITAVLARCGYQQLHTRNNPPALKKDHADLYVDLSAIAKGYGVDRLAQWLEQHQVKKLSGGNWR
ncbi:FAD:protein FMN transferase [Candidatus Venteria ishoeyi]|uniref:FAD:protein FMN transferase n=1 Tax=Candidatus Venteria ishoeyi TaxID=1899563 RepID=A0A1H6FEL3_9GAMM|nr:FAD:protein FMN transferase [Candidatus Venteria ishoeyi]SEH07606.1 Thiamine biosynthesis lipoprotein ApbE precursor [Candidatus Venteria ishoeyi]